MVVEWFSKHTLYIDASNHIPQMADAVHTLKIRDGLWFEKLYTKMKGVQFVNRKLFEQNTQGHVHDN